MKEYRAYINELGNLVVTFPDGIPDKLKYITGDIKTEIKEITYECTQKKGKALIFKNDITGK